MPAHENVTSQNLQNSLAAAKQEQHCFAGQYKYILTIILPIISCFEKCFSSRKVPRFMPLAIPSVQQAQTNITIWEQIWVQAKPVWSVSYHWRLIYWDIHKGMQCQRRANRMIRRPLRTNDYSTEKINSLFIDSHKSLIHEDFSWRFSILLYFFFPCLLNFQDLRNSLWIFQFRYCCSDGPSSPLLHRIVTMKVYFDSQVYFNFFPFSSFN